MKQHFVLPVLLTISKAPVTSSHTTKHGRQWLTNKAVCVHACACACVCVDVCQWPPVTLTLVCCSLWRHLEGGESSWCPTPAAFLQRRPAWCSTTSATHIPSMASRSPTTCKCPTWPCPALLCPILLCPALPCYACFCPALPNHVLPLLCPIVPCLQDMIA